MHKLSDVVLVDHYKMCTSRTYVLIARTIEESHPACNMGMTLSHYNAACKMSFDDFFLFITAEEVFEKILNTW